MGIEEMFLSIPVSNEKISLLNLIEDIFLDDFLIVRYVVQLSAILTVVTIRSARGTKFVAIIGLEIPISFKIEREP